MAENVFLILQDNEESYPIVNAIKKDNENVFINYQPGMVRIESPDYLVINRETVSEFKGQDWDPMEIHLSMVSLSGHIEEDDDYIALTWATK